MLIDPKLFPFKEIRPQQQEVIDKLNALPDDKRFIMLECGTGTGKSGLAVAMAKTVGPAYLLTTTKQLQDQYTRDFSNTQFVQVKGKQNYPCYFTDENTTCDVGPCIALPELVHKCGENCKYFKVRAAAKKAHIMCSNYAFFFRWSDCGNWDEKRPLLVFDEAHNLESQLVSFAEIVFNPLKFLDKYYTGDDVTDEIIELAAMQPTENEVYDWILQCYKKIIKPKYDELQGKIESLARELGSNKTDSKKMRRLMTLKDSMYLLDKLHKKIEYLYRSDRKNWIYESEMKETSAAITVKITPINAGVIFKDFIAPKATRFLFMSATLLDLKAFANSIGLPIDECAMIKLDSTFPPENAPIMALNLLDLKYKPGGIDKETKDVMINTIKQIIEAYPDSKGIIHTGNQKITQIILNAFRGNRRFLCRMESISNQDIMEEHIHSPLPTILVSSSLMDGADLYDDLSRFQIVVKMPFLSLGDKRVALKSKLYPEWYTAQTWMRLIQACGRSIRSETDTADTYILDKAFAWQFQQALNSRILPKQFVRRIQTK